MDPGAYTRSAVSAVSQAKPRVITSVRRRGRVHSRGTPRRAEIQWILNSWNCPHHRKFAAWRYLRCSAGSPRGSPRYKRRSPLALAMKSLAPQQIPAPVGNRFPPRRRAETLHDINGNRQQKLATPRPPVSPAWIAGNPQRASVSAHLICSAPVSGIRTIELITRNGRHSMAALCSGNAGPDRPRSGHGSVLSRSMKRQTGRAFSADRTGKRGASLSQAIRDGLLCSFWKVTKALLQRRHRHQP